MTARWITAALMLVASPLVGQEPLIESGSRIRVEAPSELESRGVARSEIDALEVETPKVAMARDGPYLPMAAMVGSRFL